jgi:hypothetical protein
VDVRAVDVHDPVEIERAIVAFARSGNGGLILTTSALSAVHRDLIITLAARYKLPAVYSLSLLRLRWRIDLVWHEFPRRVPARGRLHRSHPQGQEAGWQFALPAGIGDVTTGIVAVVVAAQLAGNAIGAHRATYACCLFGIADLVVAITMGAMTSPGRAHLLAFDTPNLLMTAYPLVMVPTFAVPLALMLHGLVLRRLRETAAAGRLVAA